MAVDWYLTGVSTCRMDKLVRELGTNSLSRSQLSWVPSDLDEQVGAFRYRPLGDEGPFTFVTADALDDEGPRERAHDQRGRTPRDAS